MFQIGSRSAARKAASPRSRRRLGFEGILGIAGLTVLALCALLAPWIAPHDPNTQILTNASLPPVFLDGGTWAYPLGTDQLGRDLLSRVIYGARISLGIGLTAVVLQTAIGVVIGLCAGYWRGWVDSVLMRIADVWLAIPFLVLALTLMAITGAGVWNTILVLSISGWVTFARVVRGEVLSLRVREFVVASRGMGAGAGRLIFVHLLPNVMPAVGVLATLQASHMILTESTLSFLGLGVQPPDPSWGSMISEGRAYLYTEWWIATIPGAMLVITTLSTNLIGDWFRDFNDPKLAGRGEAK